MSRFYNCYTPCTVTNLAATTDGFWVCLGIKIITVGELIKNENVYVNFMVTVLLCYITDGSHFCRFCDLHSFRRNGGFTTVAAMAIVR